MDIPLIIDDQPAGAIVVESEQPEAFDDQDLEILTAAASLDHRRKKWHRGCRTAVYEPSVGAVISWC